MNIIPCLEWCLSSVIFAFWNKTKKIACIFQGWIVSNNPIFTIKSRECRTFVVNSNNVRNKYNRIGLKRNKKLKLNDHKNNARIAEKLMHQNTFMENAYMSRLD